MLTVNETGFFLYQLLLARINCDLGVLSRGSEGTNWTMVLPMEEVEADDVGMTNQIFSGPERFQGILIHDVRGYWDNLTCSLLYFLLLSCCVTVREQI